MTFLFTDLEGSTRLWEAHDGAMREAVARHDQILKAAIAGHRGAVFSPMGDGMAAAFGSAADAIRAALGAQRELVAERWGTTGTLRVRMGIHTGDATPRDGQYLDRSVNRCARLMAVAHGGQILISGTTRALLGDALVDGATLVDLGEHHLRDLDRPERVFQLLDPALPHEFPPLRTEAARTGNLPVPASSFLGRQDEIAEIANLLREKRTVTLTGVGGVGKTRLALQVAETMHPRFRNGVWLVELARVRDADAVVEAFAAVFSVVAPRGVNLADALAGSLRTKELLLVVDNCEHVLAPVAGLLSELERSCAGVVVLATSREALGIAGEQLVGVPSLGVPISSDLDVVAASDAVRLFVERATAVKVDFEVTPANVDAVAEVARRLDGIPLALELAAARAAVLSPAQIAQRLDQRFRLLAGGERGAIERHATLRAAVDWSFDLLTESERRLLKSLSVFAGGFTLDAAEHICVEPGIDEMDVLDLLSALVARSLVVADDADPTENRYRLLETIRQYAEERLEGTDREHLRDRHARYYADFMDGALLGARGPEPREWLLRLDLELENVRSAMARAVAAADIALALRLVDAVEVPILFSPIATAVAGFLEDVVVLAADSPVDHPQAFLSAAWRALGRGDFARAEDLLDRADDLISEPTPQLRDWRAGVRGNLALTRGDFERGIAYFEEAAAACAEYDAYNYAWQLCTIVALRGVQEDLVTIVPDAERVVALARREGNPLLETYALGQLALTLASSEPDAARGISSRPRFSKRASARAISMTSTSSRPHSSPRSSANAGPRCVPPAPFSTGPSGACSSRFRP